ncbi:MAG: hypothetical protein FWH14_03385 [Oscillospiraceae bacterium]|nr:hypothetical protein [Oscillospiraceae bacterium]
MKKSLSIFTAAMLLLMALTACGETAILTDPDDEPDDIVYINLPDEDCGYCEVCDWCLDVDVVEENQGGGVPAADKSSKSERSSRSSRSSWSKKESEMSESTSSESSLPESSNLSKLRERDFRLGAVLLCIHEEYKNYSLEFLLPELFEKFDAIQVIDSNLSFYESMKDHPNAIKERLEFYRSKAGTEYKIILTPATKESVLEAVEMLEQNPHIRYAHPNWILFPATPIQ